VFHKWTHTKNKVFSMRLQCWCLCIFNCCWSARTLRHVKESDFTIEMIRFECPCKSFTWTRSQNWGIKKKHRWSGVIASWHDGNMGSLGLESRHKTCTTQSGVCVCLVVIQSMLEQGYCATKRHLWCLDVWKISVSWCGPRKGACTPS
jgi:hypothetical protein